VSAPAFAQEIVERPRALAAGHDGARAERQKRHGEIAIGMRGEQITAHRSHGADRRSADRTRDRMQEGKVAVVRDLGHGHAGADADGVARKLDLAQRSVGGAYDPAGDGAGIDEPHHAGSAAQKDRVATAKCLRGIGKRRMGFHDYRHHPASRPIWARIASNPPW
jgi:hypothetical protein